MDEVGKMPPKKVVVSVIEHNPVSGIHASTISLPKPFVAQTVRCPNRSAIFAHKYPPLSPPQLHF